MVIQLRPIVRQDAKRLADLLGHLGYPTDEVTVRDRLGHWSDDPASVLIGADDDGDLIGVAALHTMPMLEVSGKLGRLLALVVDERCRGRGAGRLLVAAAEERAWAAGCVRMEITSSRHRVRTHDFYQRLGYEDRCASSARFLKVLSPPGE
ncbi:GNAT family N-acetyltransferase [Actinoplanes sp. NEAU-A12]|uniref:GNAT family N-acetyltransferase n=1 Tax=Actinoplanes sandaracinus TaxID=3045177 RepID=A0ABT6WVJ4_9ACTN|nr:GNAT family N-acetyltransferase [Actinoplanes sandaracinus]MDI6103764.1 GNAT family N-acetyltransferase [Actinoplanes sandaracinus]